MKKSAFTAFSALVSVIEAIGMSGMTNVSVPIMRVLKESQLDPSTFSVAVNSLINADFVHTEFVLNEYHIGMTKKGYTRYMFHASGASTPSVRSRITSLVDTYRESNQGEHDTAVKVRVIYKKNKKVYSYSIHNLDKIDYKNVVRFAVK